VDEHLRVTSMEKLAGLRAPFRQGASVTAGGATAGVAPRIMGFGPSPASQKLMARLGLARGGKRSLCIGVGQGIAVALERV